MLGLRLMSALGLMLMLVLAWALSENRRVLNVRVILWGLGLQLALGLLLLRTGLRDGFFEGARAAFDVLYDATAEGAQFVFGSLPRLIIVKQDALQGELVQGQFVPINENVVFGAAIAFQVLPVIIFVSGISAILYHLRIIQAFVYGASWLMRRTMRTSGAETLGAALLIFIGIESTAAIRGYLSGMTRSELCTIMTCFMATIAGSVMVVYASFGAPPGHLIAASLMSAPAAIAISKLLVPEEETPETAGPRRARLEVSSTNVLDAATQGTATGLNMALHVGAMLIVFIGLIYLLNAFFTWAVGISFETGLGYALQPFAIAMGVPWDDAARVGQLLGTKTVFNEFLAYQGLQQAIQEGALSERAQMIATYALCGFANPGSIGIMIAGLDALVPERRAEISALSVRAFVGGTLACFMTACVAGLLLDS